MWWLLSITIVVLLIVIILVNYSIRASSIMYVGTDDFLRSAELDICYLYRSGNTCVLIMRPTSEDKIFLSEFSIHRKNRYWKQSGIKIWPEKIVISQDNNGIILAKVDGEKLFIGEQV